MKDDVMSGISFMVNMVIVCLSITIGLLLSKVFLHDGILGATKMVKRRQRSKLLDDHVNKPQDESEQGTVAGNEHEEDEHMAI